MRPDDPAGWLDESEDELDTAPDPNRRKKLLLAAGLPWLVLPLLLWVVARPSDEAEQSDAGVNGPATVEAAPAPGDSDPLDGAGEAGEGADAEGEAREGADAKGEAREGANAEGEAGAAAAAGGHAGSVAPSPPPAAGAAGSGGLDDRTAAAAELAVRGHVTSQGERLAYVDHARAEGVENVGGLRVVRVAALVLTGDEEGWDATRWHRLAVALTPTGDGGLVPVAPPWDVTPPAPPPTADAESLAGFDEPHDLEGAVDALARAGYTDIGDVEAFADPARPGLRKLVFEASLPGAPRAAREVLAAPDPPRVLGAPRDPPEPPSEPDPASADSADDE